MAKEEDVAAAFAVAEPVIQFRYKRMLSRAKISHRFDTDDLVQQTFFKAVKSCRKCKATDTEAVVNWVLKIAANCARTAITANTKCKIRATTREVGLLCGAEGKERAVVELLAGDEVANTVETRSEYDRAMACVDRLSRHKQRMLRMRFLEQKSVAEIAKEMECSEAAVRSSIAAAVLELRCEFGQYSLPGFE